MSITKEQFRKNCLSKAKRPLPNRVYRNHRVNALLAKKLRTLKGRRTILFYLPLPFEADIRKTLNEMRKKHTVLVPFMEGKSFKMVPYRLPLKRKKFGIYEAGNSFRKFKKLDVAIVPTVGIDRNFKRVGFGKGMYDRFFAKLRTKPYTIFIQLRLCATQEAVCDSYDITADMLITSEMWLEKRE